MSLPIKQSELYSYLAGLIDADGSITIVARNDKGRRGFRIRLSYYCCNPVIINLLKRQFGGKVVSRQYGKNKLKENYRVCLRWHIYDNQAANLIRGMLPYLLVKKRQARYCLLLQTARDLFPNPHFRWHPEDRTRFLKFGDKLKTLCNIRNTRGASHPIDWVVQNNKKEKLPYLAGFIDGDGSIMITSQVIKRWENFKPKVAIANRNIQIMNMFNSEFGGKYYTTSHKATEAPKYQSDLVNEAAIEAILKIKPYLLLKSRQADLLLQLDEIKKLENKYEQRVTACSELKKQCQLLNKRGA